MEGLRDALMRQAGLAGRYAVSGTAGLGAAFANPLAVALNYALEKGGADYRFPDQYQALQSAMTQAGLPEPQGAIEKGVGFAAELGVPDPTDMIKLAAIVPALAKSADLPMDTASRMRRADEMGFDTDVYHGTHADIEEFDPSMVDIGVHLGSKDQAINRLKDVAKQRSGASAGRFDNNFEEGANVMPIKANLGKSLELPDVGRWDDSEQVLAALEDMPQFRGRLDADWEELGVKDQFESTQDWIESPENREMLDLINGMLRESGYGSVKYKNAVENVYGHLTDLKPEIAARKKAINDEIKTLNEQILSRRPALSDNVSEAELQKWLDWDEKAARTVEEDARLTQLRDESFDLGNNEAHYQDPYSYIALSPESIRSRFAAFDPAKKDSTNILASHPAATVLGGSLAAALLAQMAGNHDR